MHELGLCTSIVDAVEQRAGDRVVRRVRVRVGRLHHVHADAFQQSFAVAAHGTVAHGAVAELILVPVTAQCTACGARWEGDELPVACTTCGGFDVEVTGGDELMLESLEYEG